jgi:UDP-GlcNAc:undecaprenyl-phosphate GlcNAc-1-phosphate transferase
MRPELSAYLVVAGVGFLATACTVPVFMVLSRRFGLLVAPDSRRMHERPTSTLGGGAMYVGFVAAFVVAWRSGWFDASFQESTEPWAILACATVAYLVGVLDDLIELSPPAKIAGMVFGAGLLAAGGVSIIWFRVPFLDVFVLPYDLAFVATVVWVLGLVNAVNFIDGLDGLAAGIVGIGATAFLLYGYRLGEVELLLPGNVGPLVAAAVLGICTGFLPWNVYPARIFMGDGGALLLGALMAASTMAVGGRTPDPFSGQTFFFYAPLAIPLVILGVPVLDTAFAILRRARGGKGLATADKDHLHHRLVRLGHGHRRSVWILWAWTALLSAFVLYPTYNDGQGDAVVPLGVGAAALVLLTLFRPGFRFDQPLLRAPTRRPGSEVPAAEPAGSGPGEAAEPIPAGPSAPAGVSAGDVAEAPADQTATVAPDRSGPGAGAEVTAEIAADVRVGPRARDMERQPTNGPPDRPPVSCEHHQPRVESAASKRASS